MKFKDCILTEMSRASDRVLGKDSLENLLYILSDYVKKDENPTYNRLSKFIEEYGLDWETVAKQLNIPPSYKTSKAKSNLMWLITSIANKYDIDIINDRDVVDYRKDEADKLIDLFWKYYKAKHNDMREEAANIANSPEFAKLIDWVANEESTVNDETAQEAFGRYYNADVIRTLKPFLMGDSFAGSDEEAIEEFWNWHRAKKAGHDYTISKDMLERLGTNLEREDAMEIFDKFYYYVVKEVGNMLGRKLLAPGEEPPLNKELKRIMNALDNPEYIDKIEAEEKKRLSSGNTYTAGIGGASSIGFDAIPAAALRRIVAIAAEDGAVDKAKVGEVDKAQVRQCYQYCMNQLNRKFHVGQKGAFDGTLQEFYDKFKIVFPRGYTTNTLKKIFDEVTTFLVDQLDQETANYWKNKEDVSVSDSDDFNEALRVVRKAGYRVIKESARRRINECDKGCKLYTYESDEQRDVCQKLYNLFDFDYERTEGLEKAYKKAVKELKNLCPEIKEDLIPKDDADFKKKFGRSISL